MGCFSVQHERKAKYRSASSSSLASPQSLLADLKQETPCNGSGRELEFGAKPSSLRHSVSFKLMKTHLKPSAGSSPLRKLPFLHRDNSQLAENSTVKRSFSYEHGDERLNISHSSPLSSLLTESELGISNTHRFPLPLPPMAPVIAAGSTACTYDSSSMTSVAAASSSTTSTDDSSSQSVSSTGSGSSLSPSIPFASSSASVGSVNSKSCYNSLSSSSIAERHPFQTWHPSPLPLPPPPNSCARLREFSYDELAGACLNFAPEFFIREGGAGPVFKAILQHAPEEEGNIGVAVTRLSLARLHSFKKWRTEVGSLARLSHPHLCKVLGFSGEDPSRPPDKVAGFERERLLVYEHTPNGSLESLLYCRKGKAPLDWAMRLKIAMGAAQGLAYLHDRIPRQIIYKSFKTINVQVDLNFNAKLSDYGFARSCRELPISSPARCLPVDDVYAAPETRISDALSTKSNVWSFGIVLLELLTGRQNMDDFFPPEERNLLQWCRPYLLDSKRLYLIMDPELKGRYPTKTAKLLADLALHCLAEDPVVRPSMRDVATCICAHTNAYDVGDIKVDCALNMSATYLNGISNMKHANCIGFSNGVGGWGKPSYDGSIHNYGSKFKLSKSYNLASVLASPARVFAVGMAHGNENVEAQTHSHKTRMRGFLSGEISKEASRSVAREHPFLSGEIGITKSPISQDYYLPPPLGRSISSSRTPIN